MVKETGLFDYGDKTPAANEVEQFLLTSKKCYLSIRCGGWFYMLERDEIWLQHSTFLSQYLWKTYKQSRCSERISCEFRQLVK